MFTAKISISKTGNLNALPAAVDDLFSCWYKNGQIVGSSWVIADADDSLDAYVSLPERDSLEPIYNNLYAMKCLEALTPGACNAIILGRDPSRSPCCACTSRSAIILFTHYLSEAPPVRCFDCFDPIPLYKLPHVHDREHLVLLQWAADYRSCDTLQMHTTTGERFGEQQLRDHDSSLSRNGRDLSSRLEQLNGTPCYYYLHKTRSRGVATELERHCPSCGAAWHLPSRHHIFDFQCKPCRLLSAIAADAS